MGISLCYKKLTSLTYSLEPTLNKHRLVNIFQDTLDAQVKKTDGKNRKKGSKKLPRM